MRGLLLSIIALMLLTACYAPFIGMYEGTAAHWKDETLQAIYTIGVTEGKMQLMRAVSLDGDTFTIIDSGWTGDKFSWEVESSQTGEVLKYEVISSGDGRMDVRWRTAREKGERTLIHIERKPSE